jgi:hypothetical protein
MVSRTYAWLATSGGAWSLASNWNDLTDGIDPSLTVPGPQDNVLIGGPTGSSVETLTGQANVGSAVFSGNSVLAGSFTMASLAMGQGDAGGLLDVGAAATLNAGTLAEASGSLIANGAGSAIAAISATLGDGEQGAGAAACNLYATGGGRVQIGTLVLNASTATLYADTASSIEIGTLGGAALGALTIDPGAMLSGQGDADAYAAVVNNGTIAAQGGTLLVGALSGHGLLEIGAGAVLTLNGATAAGQAVQFAGAMATLALATEFDAPQGTTTGFAAGDAIDLLGSPISAATYATGSGGTGTLTLYYGSQVADRLILAGNYAGDVFLTASDGQGGTLITVTPESGGGGGASGGTTSPDQYLWTAASGGNWNNAANWTDQTTGAAPAKVAPGVHNLVTINAPQTGGFMVVAGPANAAILTATGDLALAGVYNFGTLTVGQGGSANGNGQVNAALDLLPGAHAAVGTALVADGELSVSGSAVLAVSGTLTMGGGSLGVGLPVTMLSATAGGTITAGSLVIGGGSGDSITTDPTGVVEIGTTGGGAAGAVTVDAGASLTGNGSVNPFGVVVDNGTITASGGGLLLGQVSGTGQLDIGAGAGLVLEASTSLSVTFAGAAATLAVGDELVALSGTLAGFAAGDTIDILEDPITGFSIQHEGANTGLTLYYGSTVVSSLTLAGSFTGEHFVLTPDGQQGTDIQVVGGNGGGGGGGGQGNTDTLAWAQPGSGAWNRTSNWLDVTTGAAALAPPGSQNNVQLAGAQGSFQTIGGPGVCATLTCFGDTLLTGAFTTGTLLVGGLLSGQATPAILDVGASSGATAATALVDGGTILVEGSASTLSVTATLTLGGVNDGTLSAGGGGVAQLGGLVLAGMGAGDVSADLLSSVEIGAAGHAALGAVTIDAGFAISGYGGINTGGAVIDNGTVTAQGGTLVVGACSGTGTLCIGTEATLELVAAETCAMSFTGNGASLLLETAAVGGIIAGFAAGDSIVTGFGMVSSVIYTPGAGNLGTLSLFDGASQVGSLLLAGNFAGDMFTVVPDGAGSAIGVQIAGGGGPSGGTTTPDDYVWTGMVGTLWNSAANWSDLSAGQQVAAVAPGAQDLVTIQGAAGNGFQAITGPADAAALTLLGGVALGGEFSVGTLSVGHGTVAGELAIGGGTALSDAAASVFGAVLVQNGGFATAGTLSLQGGLLQATGQAVVEAGVLMLLGSGDAVTTDANGRIDIGGGNDGLAGAITIDANGLLAGAGAVNPQGTILDNGTVVASGGGGGGGTLALGNVTGAGLLVVGADATLNLLANAAGGLVIDFAGPGTLLAATAVPLAAIAGFGDGDTIVLPLTGVTAAEYAATGPGTGVLTLYGGSVALGQITLDGVGLGQSFTVASTGGGTSITTQTTAYGGGGSNMGNNQPTSGSGAFGVVSSFAWWENLPSYVQDALAAFQAEYGGESWVWTSPDGTGFGDPSPAVANIAVAADPVADSKVVLPPGYNALLAQGGNPVVLTDNGAGHALIVGNAGNDSIVGFSDGDTLVGGSGNSIIWCADSGSIDTIVTSPADARITTSTGNRSIVFLGAADNQVTLNGQDSVVCGAGNGAADTITATGSDTVFGPGEGQLTLTDGTGRDLVVASAGTVRVIGGTGNGGVLWCGAASLAEYTGGAGSEVVVGGSGLLSVQGGAGAITVFGGSGATQIRGAAGRSQFVLGSGNATVVAAAGNDVWLAGAANDSLVASGGNILLWAAGATGNSVFQAGSGPTTIHGGLGADTFLGGGGGATITGGGGADVYSFTNGLAGGAVQITDFNTGVDQIDLHGYGSYSATVVGGNELLHLSDGTQIQLDGITSLVGVSISVG